MDSLRLYASDRSAGKRVSFMGEDLVVEETSDDSFNNVDIALFSAAATSASGLHP